MKMKNCVTWIQGFFVYIKTDYIYKEIVETRFHSSNFELNRPLPKEKKKKSNQMNETQIRLKNHEKIVGLREKTYTYLIDHSSADKKTKSTEK